MREPRYSLLTDIQYDIELARQGKFALYGQRNIAREYRCKKATPEEQQEIPVIPATGEVAGATIAEQAEQSCKNVGAVLAAGGASFETVIKTTCFLANMADFQAFNAVYEKYFVSAPARSCVAVKDLPKGVLCEVEAIAYVAK